MLRVLLHETWLMTTGHLVCTKHLRWHPHVHVWWESSIGLLLRWLLLMHVWMWHLGYVVRGRDPTWHPVDVVLTRRWHTVVLLQSLRGLLLLLRGWCVLLMLV